MVKMSLYLWIPDPNLRQAMREHTANRRATDSGVDLICGHHVFPISPRTTWPVRFAPVAWLQP